MARMNAVVRPSPAVPGSADPLLGSVLEAARRLALTSALASGPRTVSDLARASGTDAPSLHRLLRALACARVADEVEPGVFALAPAGPAAPEPGGEPGRAAVPGLIPMLTADSLLYSVRTGQPAVREQFGQQAFDYIASSPVASAALAAFTAAATDRTAPALVGSADFARFGTVIDIGGGTGTLIKHILRAIPPTRGVVFDTAAAAPAAIRVLGSVPELASRWDVRAGDFFREVPPGGDAYVLKSVLHDWADREAAQILRNCRAAMAPAARLIVFEPVLPQIAGWSPAYLPAVLSDLICLVMTDGGRERTEAEYRALFGAAGLEAVAVSPVAGSSHFFRLEATAAARSSG
jgi:hypothetical protein